MSAEFVFGRSEPIRVEEHYVEATPTARHCEHELEDDEFAIKFW